MIRSARIPDILSRVITAKDPVIQTVLLVTTDGELLGSTSSTYTNTHATPPASTSLSSETTPGSANSNNTMSIEHLGALIADIAVDYQQLGDVMNNNNNSNSGGSNSNAAPNTMAFANSNTNNQSSSHNNNNPQSSANTSSNNNKSKKSTTLLLELDQGLVGVISCLDCWIIAIAATPTAPLGMIQARLQAIAEYVQEGLSPLLETVMDR